MGDETDRPGRTCEPAPFACGPCSVCLSYKGPFHVVYKGIERSFGLRAKDVVLEEIPEVHCEKCCGKEKP
jgi:hypothetical protein